LNIVDHWVPPHYAHAAFGLTISYSILWSHCMWYTLYR